MRDPLRRLTCNASRPRCGATVVSSGFSIIGERLPPRHSPKADPVTRPNGFSRRTGIRTDPKTGEVIKRQVTVFSNVRHGPGTVTTGWTYRDGGGGAPFSQYCYYEASNIDNSRTRVDIASNRVTLPINTGMVPDLREALAKCQWWQE
jgi:hypothetical protein